MGNWVLWDVRFFLMSLCLKYYCILKEVYEIKLMEMVKVNR